MAMQYTQTHTRFTQYAGLDGYAARKAPPVAATPQKPGFLARLASFGRRMLAAWMEARELQAMAELARLDHRLVEEMRVIATRQADRDADQAAGRAAR